MDECRRYPSDLSDGQWELVRPLVERPRRADGRGRPLEVDLRAVVNAVLYVLREGCRWRALPHDFPAWQTVYWYFRTWSDDGTLVRVHDTLRRRLRQQAGRDPEPSAVVIDSQSVKTSAKGGTLATTRARKSRARSASSRSIRMDC
jgi:transposase